MSVEAEPKGWTFPVWMGLHTKGDAFRAKTGRRILIAYMLGFTEAIADEDFRLKASHTLFDAMFGEDCDERLMAFGMLYATPDVIRSTMQLGLEDGRRFFATCDQWCSCTAAEAEDAFINLPRIKERLESEE
jgi:hypothetical protein